MAKTVVLPMLVAALSFGTASVAAAQTSTLRMTVEKPHFTCERHGRLLSRVAYLPDAAAQGAPVQDGVAGPGASAGEAPLPCCDGKIGCAQFLSTNTVIRPDHALRG